MNWIRLKLFGPKSKRLIRSLLPSLKILAWLYTFESILASSWAAEKNTVEPDLYVKLPHLFIPIIQERQVKAIYKLIIFVELTTSHHSALVQKLQPRLVNAILLDLYGILHVVWNPNYHINLLELKKRLRGVAEGIVGKDVIKDILVQDLQTQ